MIIPCPHCGDRDHHEFSFRREAAPVPDRDAGAAAWFDYVYLRRNEKGVHREWWQHSSGCRALFMIERDTASNSVVVDDKRPGAA